MRNLLPIMLLSVGSFSSPDGRTNALTVDGETILRTHCANWIEEDPELTGHPCTPLGVRREGMPEENPSNPGRGGLASSARFSVTSRTEQFLPGAGNCLSFQMSAVGEPVEKDVMHLCSVLEGPDDARLQVWLLTPAGWKIAMELGGPPPVAEGDG